MSSTPCDGGRLALQEAERLGGELLLAVEQRPPDPGCGGQVRQEASKRFYGQPAVISDVAQCVERRVPKHAAASGHAAVVLRDVDVSYPVACTADRRRQVLLLDMRVKSVEVDAAVGMTDLVDETDSLVE